MGLILLKQRDGQTLRSDWYGEYRDGGKRRVVNLNVPWTGTPPYSLSVGDAGDDDFERSRDAAKVELAKHMDEASRKGKADHLIERLIESKTGDKVEYTKLADLAARWRTVPRKKKKKKGGAKWLSHCDNIFNRFVAAMPASCKYLYQVKQQQAQDYLDTLQKELSIKTMTNTAQMLKSAFDYLLPAGHKNPFEDLVNYSDEDTEGEMIHRRPFTVEELQLLFDASRNDDFLYPLIVTAALTGLRRGDVCRLTWKAVKWREGVIEFKTSKTKKGVEIPIFAPLRAVLEAALAEKKNKAVFVFPAAERMLSDNPDGLTWRFKKIIAKVIKESPEDAPEATIEPLGAEGRAQLTKTLPNVCKAIEAKIGGNKAARITDNVKRYATGQSLRAIHAATGQSKNGISIDLHQAEKVAGFTFMPTVGIKGNAAKYDTKARISRLTRDENAKGRTRRASILDWHALRVTWVTLALSSGVPVEVAKLVTGHKTVEVVLKHYFKPQAGQLREVLAAKLPAILIGSEPKRLPSPADELAALAAKLATGTATDEEKQQLRALAANV